MRPLFTIHAGEFLVGEHIERTYPGVKVWVPTKDTGVDLLLTGDSNRRTVSLQVKFSRDFLATHMAPEFQKPLRACGWWTLNREKIAHSTADYWVFVLLGFARRSTDYVVIKPQELLTRLTDIHGSPKILQSYLWVTEKNRCWETRGLAKAEQSSIADDRYSGGARDFTAHLNDWRCVEQLVRH